jgi:hypothetical protein
MFQPENMLMFQKMRQCLRYAKTTVYNVISKMW